tara:strand:- start:73 stop:381 length:309 start_codon:yes stop_codon:yes gene_type:complete
MKKVLLFLVLLSLNSTSCFANCIAKRGIESVDKLNVFINPTNHDFIVDLTNESNTIEVFYVLGKLFCLQETEYLKQLNVDFSESSKVIYFVKVQENTVIIKH